MKSYSAGKLRPPRSAAGSRPNHSDHPIRTLQRLAGNRAVASLITGHVQRKDVPGKKEAATPKLAWTEFQESAIDPWRQAIALVGQGKNESAGKEMDKTFTTALKLAGRFEDSSPETSGKLRQIMGHIQSIGERLRPKPAPVLEQMQTFYDTWLQYVADDLMFAERH